MFNLLITNISPDIKPRTETQLPAQIRLALHKNFNTNSLLPIVLAIKPNTCGKNLKKIVVIFTLFPFTDEAQTALFKDPVRTAL